MKNHIAQISCEYVQICVANLNVKVNILRSPSWQEADQLDTYKLLGGVEFKPTENKSKSRVF